MEQNGEPRNKPPYSQLISDKGNKWKNKDKERILKAAKEKDTVTYKGVPIRLSADFSKETLQARRS